jgi:nicotinamide riboside transporter PnuC
LWPAIVLFLVLQVGVAVPSSPGRVGVFQYLTILALGLFGLSKEIGLLAGVLLHLVVFLPIVSLGSWFLWRSWSHWQTLLNRTWQALSGKWYPNPSP